MTDFILSRSIALAGLFVKEQLKEPIALFWIVVSPAVTYYLLAYSRGGFSPSGTSYLDSTSWFYAYISSSVAFYGFSFYIVGRRESGFTRSFIYTFESKLVFMLAQFFAYSIIAFIYYGVFYMLTCFNFGGFEMVQFFLIFFRFYLSFMLFCVPGLLLALLPINFQNANTIFSVVSFGMLALGIFSAGALRQDPGFIIRMNPLYLANKILAGGVEQNLVLVMGVFVVFVVTFLLSMRWLHINPVWSRY
jgi:ABC-2 type transport system permease protein